MTQVFSTGARKETEGKPRVDLIPGIATLRKAAWYSHGAKKYELPGQPGSGEWNWEKGIPFSQCLRALGSHYNKYLMGDTEEDHLAAIGFWSDVLMTFENTGRTELDDRHEFKGVLVYVDRQDVENTVFECDSKPDDDDGKCCTCFETSGFLLSVIVVVLTMRDRYLELKN